MFSMLNIFFARIIWKMQLILHKFFKSFYIMEWIIKLIFLNIIC